MKKCTIIFTLDFMISFEPMFGSDEDLIMVPP